MTEADRLAHACSLLADWVAIAGDCGFGDDDAKIAKATATLEWLKEKQQEWDVRQRATPERTTAMILADMLHSWKLAGAIWCTPTIKRYRLVGVDYKPKPQEFCLGVFLPTATTDDIEAAIVDFERERADWTPPISAAPAPEAPKREPVFLWQLSPSVVHYIDEKLEGPGYTHRSGDRSTPRIPRTPKTKKPA